MESQLQGKVAIITGSSSGIGEAIALLFAARGAKVTLCGRDHERLKSVYDEAVKVSGEHLERFHSVQGDLNDPNVREAIIAQTIQKFGHLDILVSNAGVMSSHFSFLDETEETYNEVMDTNVKSVFFLIQKAVPHLEKTKGNIINISSVGSTMAFSFAVAYCSSKSALDHLTRCLAVDLGPKGIRVNSVNPGAILTRIMRGHNDLDMKEFIKSKVTILPPVGRDGISNDIAEAVAFLASDAAGFITGENIKVDGGLHLMGSATSSRTNAEH